MKVSQKYCYNDYHLDYPRKDIVLIDNAPMTEEQKEKVRNGEMVSAPDRGGAWTQYFIPIRADSIAFE